MCLSMSDMCIAYDIIFMLFDKYLCSTVYIALIICEKLGKTTIFLTASWCVLRSQC